MRRIVSLLSLLVLLALPLSAQRLDTKLTIGWDKAEHFAAGAGIEVAGHVIIPQVKPWQRVLVTTTIGAAYELGQGRFDVWDLTADFLGGVLVEIIW